MIEAMVVSEKLRSEFIQACEDAGGMYLTSAASVNCLLKPHPLVNVTLSTLSPIVKVESGYSHIELFNVEEIEYLTVPERIKIRDDRGHIVTVRPDTGLIRFYGDMKGEIA